jgi:hypothetical protein
MLVCTLIGEQMVNILWLYLFWPYFQFSSDSDVVMFWVKYWFFGAPFISYCVDLCCYFVLCGLVYWASMPCSNLARVDNSISFFNFAMYKCSLDCDN